MKKAISFNTHAMKRKCLLLALVIISCKIRIVDGTTFKIELDKNGAGGYQWEFKGNEQIILIDSTQTSAKNENGFSEYKKIYQMKARKPGIYKLKFVKKRSFQKGIKDTAIIEKKIWIKVPKKG